MTNSVNGAGNWTIKNALNKQITIRWTEGGWIDELELSPDNTLLDGHNQNGFHVFGKKSNNL